MRLKRVFLFSCLWSPLFTFVHLCYPIFNMPTLLEQSILKTLCWFSVTDYPVTGFEIWKWLLEPDRAYELSEVFRVLESSEWLHNRITNENGYYMIQNDSISLPCEGEGRGEGFDRVGLRQEHYLDAIRQY